MRTETWQWATRSETKHPASGIISAPGVYAIYLDGVLVYIGSSCNLEGRFYQWRHLLLRQPNGWSTPWGSTSTMRIKIRRSRFYGEWATQELRLIRRLKPRGNLKHKALNKAYAAGERRYAALR